MRGLPYYEEPEYHKFLTSRARRELYPGDQILSQLRWENIEHMLDFGMGPAYFLPAFKAHLSEEAWIWGAECQEVLIDFVLSTKNKENITNFIPFFVERTEHPLLPDWIPPMDLIFCSCVLSTFADPALAIRGISRSLREDASIVIIDWEKVKAPAGPGIEQKVSRDRMTYFIEDAGFKVVRTLKTSKFVYGLEVLRNPDYESVQQTASRLSRVPARAGVIRPGSPRRRAEISRRDLSNTRTAPGSPPSRWR